MKPKFLLVVTFLASMSTSLYAQQTPNVSRAVVADSGKRVVYDGQAFWGRSSTLPEWHHGYLVSWDVETFQQDQSNVRLFDRSGTKVAQAAIWFPGTTRVLLTGAAATSDGRIIAVGEANKSDGTTGHFIAATDKSGKVTQVIQTEGFYPSKVCVAPDETIWSFGSRGFSKKIAKPGNTLEHFDMDKGEIGAFLPRSAFPDHSVPDSLSHMECSADEVVVYSTTTSKFVAMKYGADAPKVYDVTNAPSGVKMVGFASPGHSEVFALFNKLAINGMYELKLNDANSTAVWTPIDNTTEVDGLWGSDSDSLVVSRAQDAGGVAALHWAKINR